MADVFPNGHPLLASTFYAPNAFALIINAAWGVAEARTTAFDAVMATVMDNANGVLADDQKPLVVASTAGSTAVTEPLVDIPASVDIDTILEQFDSKYLEVITVLSDYYSGFISSFFPNESQLYADTMTWLSDAINNPAFAIPQAIMDQMLADERQRVSNDSTKAYAQLLDDFAARGFPLPNGVLAAASVDIQEKGMDEIAKAARTVVIENFKLTYEKTKFAITQAMEMRKLAMGNAAEYIKALASAPDTASKALGLGYDAQSKLISSVSQYYGARINAAELIQKNLQFNAGQSQGVSTKQADVDIGFIGERVKALLAQVSALSQMSTALYNNINASTGLSGSTSYSESKELI